MRRRGVTEEKTEDGMADFAGGSSSFSIARSFFSFPLCLASA